MKKGTTTTRRSFAFKADDDARLGFIAKQLSITRAQALRISIRQTEQRLRSGAGLTLQAVS